MEEYRLLIKPSAVKEIEDLPRKKDRQRVVARIRTLRRDPRPPGCEKLSGRGHRYRVRQGPYRILYKIEDETREVVVVKVGHRRDVYR